MGNKTNSILPGGSVVKNLPAEQDTQVCSLGWKDPLQKEMVTLSSVVTGEIPWTEEPAGLQSMESQKSWTRFSNWTATNSKTSSIFSCPSFRVVPRLEFACRILEGGTMSLLSLSLYAFSPKWEHFKWWLKVWRELENWGCSFRLWGTHDLLR